MKSPREIYIAKELTNLGIKFEREKIFPDCKHKGFLRFDFYLPEHSIAIEYDGVHHVKPVYFWGDSFFKLKKEVTLKNLREIKIRDNIKNKFCEDKNIKLIRLNYKNYKKIGYILKKSIKNFTNT